MLTLALIVFGGLSVGWGSHALLAEHLLLKARARGAANKNSVALHNRLESARASSPAFAIVEARTVEIPRISNAELMALLGSGRVPTKIECVSVAEVAS